ncbi:major facilitator superfamily domain-containing protein [Fusarium oxysporum]|nr:major facilitator superfamily domain-containing protein [Fusarium oxysporum]
MDCHQVTSRALYEDDEINDHANQIDQGNENNGKTGTDLEKQPTAASTASFQETYPEGGLQAWSVAYVLDNQLTEYSEGTVGWIFSIYTFLAFFCGVYIGPVFDKYGPRWLVIAGAAFTVGGMIFMSFATGKTLALCRRLCLLCGFGSSLLFTPSIAAVGHFFKARRGLATGVASTAGGLGGIIYPFMLTRLIEKIGYGWATRVIALICLGFGKDFSYNLIPILNAGSVIGRLLPGYYADVIGPFNVSILAVILAIVACFCVWLPLGGTTAGVIIFTVLFGFSSGTSIAIAPVCIGRLCKTQEYGRYYATAYTIVSFACLIGIPIGGSIVQANGGEYWGLIILTGAVYVASMISLFLAKVTLLGWHN